MATRNLATGTKIIIPLVLLAIFAVIFFFFFNMNQRAERKAISSIEEERQQWHEKVTVLEKKALETNTSGKETYEPDAPVAFIEPLQGKQVTGNEPRPEDICHNTILRLDRLFSHLDEKQYIQQFGFQKGSKEYLTSITKKLYTQPPQIIRETDSLISIMLNAAHLYRVLGKHDINILKTILENEKDTFEPMLASFFEAAEKNDQCLEGKYPLTLPLKELYSYSTFFLNTMGGQAYLFRRDPVTRILVNYYSLLILHKANEQGINTSGIDIRPGLKSLIDELLVISVLQKRDTYLNAMLVLQAKYDQQYGLENASVN
jgi:hypothetical protein